MPEELDHSTSVVFADKIWTTSGRCRAILLTMSLLCCRAIMCML